MGMFNCTPCMYICKKSDIEHGIVQPIKADETTQVNELSVTMWI